MISPCFLTTSQLAISISKIWCTLMFSFILYYSVLKTSFAGKSTIFWQNFKSIKDVFKSDWKFKSGGCGLCKVGQLNTHAHTTPYIVYHFRVFIIYVYNSQTPRCSVITPYSGTSCTYCRSRDFLTFSSPKKTYF